MTSLGDVGEWKGTEVATVQVSLVGIGCYRKEDHFRGGESEEREKKSLGPQEGRKATKQK